MVPRRIAIVPLAALTLVAGGCGAPAKDSAKDFSGENKRVALAIEDLQRAARKGDEGKICDQMLAAALVAKIKQASRSSCPSAVSEALKDVDGFELQVVKNGVSVNGTKATAKVKSVSGKHDRVDTLQLVKEPTTTGAKAAPVWKISALGG